VTFGPALPLNVIDVGLLPPYPKFQLLEFCASIHSKLLRLFARIERRGYPLLHVLSPTHKCTHLVHWQRILIVLRKTIDSS
jgi:hypothetical protein